MTFFLEFIKASLYTKKLLMQILASSQKAYVKSKIVI